MCDVASHASTHYTVPCGLIHSVELCLYNFCDVVKDFFLLKRKSDTVYCVLLHLVTHVTTLNHCIFGLSLVFTAVRCRFILFVYV